MTRNIGSRPKRSCDRVDRRLQIADRPTLKGKGKSVRLKAEAIHHLACGSSAVATLLRAKLVDGSHHCAVNQDPDAQQHVIASPPI